MYSRQNTVDASKVAQCLTPDPNHRRNILNYLADLIVYAHGTDSSNWNLNMDRKGKFVRFNVGHAYCFTIEQGECLVLCLKQEIKKIRKSAELNVDYVWYEDGKHRSKYFSESSITLARIPEAVGCYIPNYHMGDYMPLLLNSTRSFVNRATKKTIIQPIMKRAHSPGFIEYLVETTGKDVPNPRYSMSKHDYLGLEKEHTSLAKRMTDQELERHLQGVPKNPPRFEVRSTQCVRSPYVAELAKRKAQGICQDCYRPAPFYTRTNEPYLEVHHIKPLSDDGPDVLENVIALCPNCHRKRHYG